MVIPGLEGKRNSLLATFSPQVSTKTSLHAHFKCNRFKIFHHEDLPDYLIFAQDDCAEKCTRMPEARAELL